MKSFVRRYYPILYILLIWFIFANPYFLKGLVPYPSRYQVTFFPPWSYYQEWAGPVKNNAMPDVIVQLYPWKKFTIDTIKQGIIPFWNPYNFAGNPHIANYQSAVFSPFNFLFFIVPFIEAWSLLVLLQPLLAGLFTYLFLRELRLAPIASVLGATSFMFCGFITVWMAYGTLSMSAAFLPLCLYGIEKTFNSKKVRYSFLLFLGVSISFFSGHFQTSLYVALYCLIYIFFKILQYSKEKRLYITTLGSFLLAVILSLIQILPTMRLYSASVRSELVHRGGGIPLDHIITFFIPDFFGNPVTRNDWVGSYAEWAMFIGLIPFIFTLFAIISVRKKEFFFFLSIGIITLLLSLNTPLHTVLIASKIPVFATSIPSRIIILTCFSFAILTAFGFDYLLRKGGYRKLLFSTSCLGVVFLIIFVLLRISTVLPIEKNLVAVNNMKLPFLFWSISFLLSFVLYFLKKKKYIVEVVVTCFVLLTTIDSLRFSMKWMPFDPRDLVFPSVPVLESIHKNMGYGRVFGNLGSEVTSYYGFSSLEGYDPLYIKRYGELIQYAKDGSWWDAERSSVKIDRRGKYTDRLLDLLGVSLIYNPLADLNQGWAYPVWDKKDKYEIIYQDEKFQLYRNNTLMPRAKLFYKYEVKKDAYELLDRLFTDTFDYRNVILLEKIPLQKLDGIDENGKAEIIKYSPNIVTIRTFSSKPAILFLSDNYYDVWSVYVNGQKKEVLRADYTFRAVEVPEGDNKIEFRYEVLF